MSVRYCLRRNVNRRIAELRFIILAVLLCAFSYVNAQVTSYASVWATAGYSSLLYSNDKLKTTGNIGNSVGLGYELMTANGFVFSFGAEAQFLNSTTKHNDITVDRLMLDDDALTSTSKWYDTVLYHTEFKNFHETQHLGYVAFPVMLGMNFEHIKFTVGAKVGLNLYSNFATRARTTTTGTYQWFEEDFHDMPNHYYVSNYVVKSKSTLEMGMNVSVSANIDFNCTPSYWKNTLFFVGFFADYGVLNINNSRNNNPLIISKNTPLDFEFNSQLTTEPLQQKHVAPLYVGAKATFLFALGTSGGNVGHCNCYNVKSFLKSHKHKRR